jgi:hypothetical protein
MPAGNQIECGVGDGSGGSSPVATTTTPRGCSSRVARVMFGGHGSVAAIVGGKGPAPAKTSPPPV